MKNTQKSEMNEWFNKLYPSFLKGLERRNIHLKDVCTVEFDQEPRLHVHLLSKAKPIRRWTKVESVN